jgi:oligopeptide/dipeptide ABC transporter ATP-binding protein
MSAALLEARGLAVEYPVAGGLRVAVDGVDLAIGAGEALGLVGESGCGKTSLARALLRLEPARGAVRFADHDWLALEGAALRAARRGIGAVFQDPQGSLDPRATIEATVGEPLAVHEPAFDRAARRARVVEALARVGLDADSLGRYPHQFSGGQCQRIAIARATVVVPRLLVCDEAVSALDLAVKLEVLALLARLRRELGMAVLFISHDLGAVRLLCERVLVMYAGRIVEALPAKELARAAHPYTRALLAAVPPADPARARGRPAPEGEPPGARERAAGCAFAPRCAHRVERCSSAVPGLDERGSSAVACHRAGEI